MASAATGTILVEANSILKVEKERVFLILMKSTKQTL